MNRTVTTATLILLLIVLSSAGYVIINNRNLTPQNETPKISPETVGVCVHNLTEQDAQLISQSGAKWVRIDCNGSAFSSWVQTAKAHNLSVLAILGSWMFNGSCSITLEDWESNVTDYVTKNAQFVDAWEIWNEPASTEPGWQLQADYFSMVKIVSPIIRNSDPTAKIVLLGGLQLYKGSPDVPAEDKAFAQNLPANITDYGDAISVHAYPWGNTPTSVWTSQYASSLQYYPGLFGSLEVWVTETGQNITDCGGNEQQQAQYLADSLDFFNGKVSHVFLYALQDDNPTASDFGLVTSNGNPREVFTTLQRKLA